MALSEIDYIRGSRAAWLSMFQTCLHQLGYDSLEAKQSRWVLEREQVVRALRSARKLMQYLGTEWGRNARRAPRRCAGRRFD